MNFKKIIWFIKGNNNNSNNNNIAIALNSNSNSNNNSNSNINSNSNNNSNSNSNSNNNNNNNIKNNIKKILINKIGSRTASELFKLVEESIVNYIVTGVAY